MKKPYQLTLDEFWRPIHKPSPFKNTDMLECKEHGWWCPNAYYSGDEIHEMLEEQGFIDCPYCLLDIVPYAAMG